MCKKSLLYIATIANINDRNMRLQLLATQCMHIHVLKPNRNLYFSDEIKEFFCAFYPTCSTNIGYIFALVLYPFPLYVGYSRKWKFEIFGQPLRPLRQRLVESFRFYYDYTITRFGNAIFLRHYACTVYTDVYISCSRGQIDNANIEKSRSKTSVYYEIMACESNDVR
jgi:hypothetical protein